MDQQKILQRTKGKLQEAPLETVGVLEIRPKENQVIIRERMEVDMMQVKLVMVVMMEVDVVMVAEEVVVAEAVEVAEAAEDVVAVAAKVLYNDDLSSIKLKIKLLICSYLSLNHKPSSFLVSSY
ncbi:unnamed protein product [Moneuplotes crassus]|uniref:Uncharacterized protein n=1 Tax=Euplotes crassus TaxID=5936 RepID=A0AAD1XQM8_EUPCR|nr:unnamed protein product [Moneuplotes crassus]